MKVINGDFGKKNAEEMPLIEKLAMVSGDLVNDITDKGNFILIVETPDGMAQIATDMTAIEVNFLIDVMKQQILTGNFERGAIH
jgi:hypothetical protein